ncbi:hypothetical protein OJF2_48360 [Aquisphaera giovannonii]|uniref:HNH nuclease domain-containing protein n=1 Tax=Aquisphaera giovannonii TaxID=406548 RepID=A0A5B9W6I2_9BACT|nr:HNH endonuclease [Aquisphaera giovannonii]QEH36276.1 hypothetical protein OJF2_48360 [Aquisphaera giovannonii]
MKMPLLDRLLFVQGNRCFFCEQPLERSEASVEHLLASSKGGSNAEANCVACCRALNALLGSMSLKEKFRVVLNQRGPFRCPGRRGPGEAAPASELDASGPGPGRAEGLLRAAVQSLAAHEDTRPRTEAALRNAMRALLPTMTPEEQDALIASLKSSGKVIEEGGRLAYDL